MQRILLLFVSFSLIAGAAEARRHGRPRSKLNMPPGWTWPPTAAMRDEGRSCLARLDELGVKWKPAPVTRKVATPIFVPEMQIDGIKLTSLWRGGPFIMDCLLARALADGGSDALHSAGVTELRFSSIYSYRDIAGTRILSRHAVGLAMDVFQIVTEDGYVHVVERDYPDVALLTVERWINESGAFRYLLTPGNDPRHHWNHFHFEARSNEEVRRVSALMPRQP